MKIPELTDLIQRLRELTDKAEWITRSPGWRTLVLRAADELERTKLYDTIAHANKVQGEEIQRLTQVVKAHEDPPCQ